MHRLLTMQGEKYRLKFNDKLRTLAELHCAQVGLSPAETEYLRSVEAASDRDLLQPMSPVRERVTHAVGVIGVVLQLKTPHGPATVAIFEHREPAGGVDVNGCGKSAVALALLKIEIPWNEIHWPFGGDASSCPAAIEALSGRTIPLSVGTKDRRIVSMDMPVLGIIDGALHVAAPSGEPWLALWDLARSMTRRRGVFYRTPTGRSAEHLAFAEKLTTCLRLDFGSDGAFVARDVAHRLDHVFFLERRTVNNVCTKIDHRDYESDEARRYLVEQLHMNPLYHTSPFWDVNAVEHERRVDGIAREVVAWPNVTRIVQFGMSTDAGNALIGELIATRACDLATTTRSPPCAESNASEIRPSACRGR